MGQRKKKKVSETAKLFDLFKRLVICYMAFHDCVASLSAHKNTEKNINAIIYIFSGENISVL